MRDEEELKSKGWTEAQIAAVQQHAWKVFDEENGYECVDNQRIARADNAAECDEYDRQVENGCCGSYDTELTAVEPDGSESTIYFGFNYGH